MITQCAVCDKDYETYVVILDSNELSITLELAMRDAHYDSEKNLGLCEKCRDRIIEGPKKKNGK